MGQFLLDSYKWFVPREGYVVAGDYGDLGGKVVGRAWLGGGPPPTGKRLCSAFGSQRLRAGLTLSRLRRW